ncbi:MAG: hypothetical protein AAGB93_05710 [Planctomycetota bacterium]
MLPTLLAALIAASTPATDLHGSERAAAPTFPIPDVVLHDRDVRGAHWALGRTYKAAVAPDGFRYVPFLGSDAPRNYPVRFELVGVAAGGESVDLGAAPVPGRDGNDLTLERGHVTERYRCELDSVEQIVVIDRDDLAGDVRLSYRLETDLVRADRAGLSLALTGSHGEVRVGTAVAIAPDGRRRAVATERTEAGYDLVVPADFVASLDGPLVVDPILTTGTVNENPLRTDVSVDVAAVRGAGFFAAVERQFSATDGDVIVYFVHPSSPFIGLLVASIDFTTENWTQPSIAGRAGFEDLMIVAARGLGSGRRIWMRRSNLSGTAVDAPVLIGANRESFEPDIGTETTGPFVAKRWCVVYTGVTSPTNTDIYQRVVDPSGPINVSYRITNSLQNDRSPAISESTGPSSALFPTRFRVAFRREGTIVDEVFVRHFDRDGGPAPGAYRAAVTRDTLGVSIAGPNESTLADGSSPFLVTFDTVQAGDRDVLAAVCVEGGVVGDVVNLSEMSDTGRGFDQSAPDVSASRSQWIVTYQERTTTFADSRVVLCSGDVAGTEFGLGERRQFFAATGDQAGPRTATLWEGGETSSLALTGLTCWTNRSGGTSTEGGFVSSIGLPVAGVQYCEAEPNSSGRRAWVTVYGDNSTTSPKALRVLDAPPGVPCFFLTSRAEAFVPGVGGSAGNLCLGGQNFGRFSNFVAPTGSAGIYELTLDPQNIAQPNGTVSAAVGQTWRFQAWFRDVAGGAATSNLSNGVAVTFDS